MTTVYKLAEYREADTQVRTSHVFEALKALGGAAHRDLIAEIVGGMMAGRLSRSEVREAVDDILLRGETLFTQVFGPNTCRWALAS
jgi:hypothetical protein